MSLILLIFLIFENKATRTISNSKRMFAYFLLVLYVEKLSMCRRVQNMPFLAFSHHVTDKSAGSIAFSCDNLNLESSEFEYPPADSHSLRVFRLYSSSVLVHTTVPHFMPFGKKNGPPRGSSSPMP